MIQLPVPAEYADAVREALRCQSCSGSGGFAESWMGEIGKDCPDCPPSFWWGVTGTPVNSVPPIRYVLPVAVRRMLDPGRPLIELVTDCESLGVVTADELLPITTDMVFPDKPSIIVKSPIMVIQQPPRHWNGEDMTGPVTLFRPDGATHAIHLTVLS